MRIIVGLILGILSIHTYAQTFELLDNINKRIESIKVSDSDELFINNILPEMKKSSQNKRLPELLSLLQDKGFIDKAIDIKNIKSYDAVVEQAVRAAQSSYGLIEDGIAGKQLYVNLSVSDKLRRHTLEEWKLQLERIFNEAKAAGESKIIIVNAASYTLRVIDIPSGKIELESPVIVGRPSRKTPLFVTNITGIKYNPTWTPPPGIMKADVLPRLGKEDTTWFQQHGLVIYNAAGEELDPAYITASEYRENGYRISQPAGDDNALGVLKFETDNTENIYLHDTNSRKLFDKADRAQSSGCVRVKEWLKLASFVSGKDTSVIENDLRRGQTYIEKVRKIPVHIVYSLADISTDKIIYYPDIYNISKEPILRGYLIK